MDQALTFACVGKMRILKSAATSAFYIFKIRTSAFYPRPIHSVTVSFIILCIIYMWVTGHGGNACAHSTDTTRLMVGRNGMRTADSIHPESPPLRSQSITSDTASVSSSQI